jgi:hypothetical protein
MWIIFLKVKKIPNWQNYIQYKLAGGNISTILNHVQGKLLRLVIILRTIINGIFPGEYRR